MKTPSNNYPTLTSLELEYDAQNAPYGSTLPILNDDVLHVRLQPPSMPQTLINVIQVPA